MLFATPMITRPVARDLAKFDELRERLGNEAGVAGPWLGRTHSYPDS